MELNKFANEIVNEYLARELKDGHDKFPPASRRLAQNIFPTEGAAKLLESCSIWARQWQAAEEILSDPGEPAEPMGRSRDAKGYSYRECMAMPCTCLVMNEST